MQKSARSKAEEQFTATQKETRQILTDIERQHHDRAANMAKQKAMRLAKQAAEREAAAAEAAAKAKLIKKAARAKSAKKAAKAS